MPGEASEAYGEVAWQELVTRALLGTGRGTFALPSVGGPLAHLFEQISSEEGPPDSALLEGVAALSVYRRAGHLPTIDESILPDPCPPEELPYCSPRAAHRLFQMLRGVHDDYLGEWLEALTKAGKIVPPESLPTLLSHAHSREIFREPVAHVIGKRGEWLARLNSDWSFALGHTVALGDAEADRELWETVTFDPRLGMLHRLRWAEPQRGRELLALTWTSEKADHRARFLRAFQQGLSLDDEPFLEAALDDRSKDVRSQAANLLARLPESQLVGRMKSLALPLLAFRDVKQRGFLGVGASDKSHIEVSLPQTCTPAMKRDCIEPKPVQPGMGEKAWWLREMVARIPPRVWESAWGVSAERIIAAAAGTKEWGDLLTEAWLDAARLFGDAQWAEAFFKQGTAVIKTQRSHDMLSLLAPERREAHILDILRRKPDALYTPALPLAMIWHVASPWSLELSRAVLTSVSHYMASEKANTNWEMLMSIRGFARYMPPEIREEAERLLSGPANASRPVVKETVDDFLNSLDFRRTMLEELAS